MSETETPRRVYASDLRVGLIVILAALLCFVAAFCEAQGWLTKGTFQEWLSAGLALAVLAKLV